MIVIDPQKRNADPDYVRELIEKIGQPRAVLAAALCIDQRTFRRYVQPADTEGATPIPFGSQVLLELLASGKAKIR